MLQKGKCMPNPLAVLPVRVSWSETVSVQQMTFEGLALRVVDGVPTSVHVDLVIDDSTCSELNLTLCLEAGPHADSCRCFPFDETISASHILCACEIDLASFYSDEHLRASDRPVEYPFLMALEAAVRAVSCLRFSLDQDHAVACLTVGNVSLTVNLSKKYTDLFLVRL